MNCNIPQRISINQLINQSISQSVSQSINQSFIKYIRLTKTQFNLQVSAETILLQLLSNKISIIFWQKGKFKKNSSVDI